MPSRLSDEEQEIDDSENEISDEEQEIDDPHINEIVAQYIGQHNNITKKYCEIQIENIINVLDYIANVDWGPTHPEPIVDWNYLVEEMETFNEHWEQKLTDMYERLMRQRVVQFPKDGEIAIGYRLPPQHEALTSYEEEALTMFGAQPWTAQFNEYKRIFFVNVTHFNDELQTRFRRGDAHIRMSFTNMRFAYINLMQHVFDVPTIDDFGQMQYKKIEDPSGVQLLLQQDDNCMQLLKHAGECVLYEVDDVLNPQDHELPYLFHEMTHFYGYILERLQESDRVVTPETQPMDVESVQYSQRLQINSLLDQLRRMCHLE